MNPLTSSLSAIFQPPAAPPASQYALTHKLSADLLIIGSIAARLKISTDALIFLTEPQIAKHPNFEQDAIGLLIDGLERWSVLMVIAALAASRDRLPCLLAPLDGDQLELLMHLLNAAQINRKFSHLFTPRQS